MAEQIELLKIEPYSGQNEWRLGLNNLMAREFALWFKTRRWLVQVILWALILSGLASLMLFVLPVVAAQQEVSDLPDAVRDVLPMILQLAVIFMPTAVIIRMQGELLNEEQSGVSAWILSKPVSRSAYLLSKLVPNLVGILLCNVVIQFVLLGVIYALNGTPVVLETLLPSVGLLALELVFYVSFILMLGLLLKTRESVMAAGFGALFGGMIFSGFLGTPALYTPFGLSALIKMVSMGMESPVPVSVPAIVMAALSAIFMGISFWKIQRKEY
ncbi:MAG: hypothetical protein JW750_01565 [Anaerolineaceae bacterium]|nr:hypothetical protein [Anaerolineaceae bacterium]